MQIVHLRKYFDLSESECGLKSSRVHTNNWDLVTCQKCKIKMERLRVKQINNTGIIKKYQKSDFDYGSYPLKDETLVDLIEKLTELKFFVMPNNIIYKMPEEVILDLQHEAHEKYGLRIWHDGREYSHKNMQILAGGGGK
jgi:hypothetical protein